MANIKKTDKKELFKIIGEASFALDDLNLYLDTHPYDSDALDLYDDYRKIREAALDEYTNNYGPISAYDVNVSNNRWDWINQPWPWEGGCE